MFFQVGKKSIVDDISWVKIDLLKQSRTKADLKIEGSRQIDRMH